MQYFLNTHHVLENRRKEAHEKGSEGPRVVVVGPTDVGKSSLCKILMNYAIRMEWAPVYVDVDVGEPEMYGSGDSRILLSLAFISTFFFLKASII